MNDKSIDNLLRQAKISASPNFTEKALSGITSQSKSESSIDNICDNLLKASKLSASKNFTERALKTILNPRQSTLFNNISRSIATIATAACITISIANLPNPRQNTISEQDFADLSYLNSEISNLATLIYEQEIIDIFLNDGHFLYDVHRK